MKITPISLYGAEHGIFLKDTGLFTMSYPGPIVMKHAGKEYKFGYLMWPHMEFANNVNRLCTKLMEMGKAVHISEEDYYCGPVDVEFKPNKKMKELIADLKTLKCKGFPFEFAELSSRAKHNFMLNRKSTYEMVAFFYGHYVAGSYVHDYTAAAEYMKVLQKKFPALGFKYIGYNSSNRHRYGFKFYFVA
jgi:hypothetical protein